VKDAAKDAAKDVAKDVPQDLWLSGARAARALLATPA